MQLLSIWHRRLSRAWRAIAASPELQVALADLLREGRVFDSGFPSDGNPLAMAYLQGKRDLALRCFKLSRMMPGEASALDGEGKERFYDTAS